MDSYSNLASSPLLRVSSSSVFRTLIFCALLFLIENVLTKMTFVTVQESSKVEGIEPFYQEDNMDSMLKCYAKCDRSPSDCTHVEVTKQHDGKWSCKIFKLMEGKITSYLVSSSVETVVVATPRAKRDCLDWRNAGHKRDGVYIIHFNDSPKRVFCDMTIDGGGWIVFQKRCVGKLNFDKNWKDFKDGFGSVFLDHWLGNEFVHQYTSSHPTTMMVEGKAFTGEIARVELVRATVGDEAAKYKLSFEECKGTAESANGDICLDWNQNIKNMAFTTHDQDNDQGNGNCAQDFKGGWWFIGCFSAFLNGPYSNVPTVAPNSGIMWLRFRGNKESLKETKMMIRRI